MSQKQEQEQKQETQSQYCYILYSGNRTYVGYTVNPARRIRQHNGLIKGGARATRRAHDWAFLAIVSATAAAANFTNVQALSLEWHLKHPNGRKKQPPPSTYWGVQGRLRGMIEVLNRYAMDFTVQVAPAYMASVTELRDAAEAQKDLSNPACNVINIALLEKVQSKG
jgi:predicted GIY-YIG superfamily endonuclease